MKSELEALIAAKEAKAKASAGGGAAGGGADADTAPFPPPSGGEKTVVFVNHAQSQGRAASLSTSGHEHVLALRGAAFKAKRGGGVTATAALDTIKGATTVWTSPHVRAVQTALTGLLPLWADAEMDGTLPPHVVAGAPAPSLQLRPLVRERKGLLSMDNVGGAKGGKVVSRAIKLLSSLPKSSRPAESVTGLMGGVSCDTSEVERRWWTRTRESRKQAVARAREMLSQLQSSEHSTVVVVSHSHFLRSTFAEFLSEGACAPELAAALRTLCLTAASCALAPDGKLTRAAIGHADGEQAACR